MTGYGFTGPMTARGTVFDAKEEAVATAVSGSRSRYGYRLTWGSVLWLVLKGVLAHG